jgi:ubiquinol oxidase
MNLKSHHKPADMRDHIALGFTKFLRFLADTFFSGRYGHRAVVLETVAAVPGMVAGALQHLKSLRRMQSDNGWIKTLLDEAENERMHLMTFVQIAQPNWFERFFDYFDTRYFLQLLLCTVFTISKNCTPCGWLF